MTIQPQQAFCHELVDALFANGVRHAAVSPGSRNTPLLLAFGSHRGFEISVHHDERSGAFFALGMSKATGQPTVLCCTSGTAATEYLPAVTEARMSHTPLLVVTADRPPELQDRGAPQTINQTNLYGAAAKWFYDTGVPDVDAVADAPHLARQAVATSLEAPAGPVHINVPLRDPLVPAEVATTPTTQVAEPTLPTVARLIADDDVVARTASLIDGKRIVYVAGKSQSPDSGAAILDLAAQTSGIVFADPQSMARFGGSSRPSLISLGDLLIDSGAELPAPEAVVHFGAIHTSKPLNQWIARLKVPVVHIHDGQWQDPLGIATEVIVADPATTATRLAKVTSSGDSLYLESWRQADDAAIAALNAIPEGTEPDVARTIVESLPADTTLVAGSSMPIRLVDSYGARRDKALRVIANRGANGIDGTIATALGVAASGANVTAFVGDLTALVDAGALAEVASSQAPLTIVVLNNDGGGIFDFLPQADAGRVSPDLYRRLIRAPHGFSLVPVAAAYGIEAFTAEDVTALGAALADGSAKSRLIEVAVPPGAGPAARRAVLEAIAP